MKKKGYIFIVASLGIISSIWAVKRGTASSSEVAPLVEPAQKPTPKAIAASGIIEAFGNNISIGCPESGTVQEVFVKVDDRVKTGDPLFKLDSRELEAELKVAEAKEEVAKAQFNLCQDQLTRIEAIKDRRATSVEEIRAKEHAAAIAAATLIQMQQEKEKITTLIDRLTICSPIDGKVLQKNIQAGEYLVASNIDHPPVVLGRTTLLQVRTDIDEHNSSRIDHLAQAHAYLKNRPSYAIDLKFVRVEPLVVPKVSLTGLSKEKVDTRVLQVIYSFEPPEDLSLYVGQQVDVYLQRSALE